MNRVVVGAPVIDNNNELTSAIFLSRETGGGKGDSGYFHRFERASVSERSLTRRSSFFLLIYRRFLLVRRPLKRTRVVSVVKQSVYPSTLQPWLQCNTVFQQFLPASAFTFSPGMKVKFPGETFARHSAASDANPGNTFVELLWLLPMYRDSLCNLFVCHFTSFAFIFSLRNWFLHMSSRGDPRVNFNNSRYFGGKEIVHVSRREI